MAGTKAGAAKRKHCPICGTWAHEGPHPKTGPKFVSSEVKLERFLRKLVPATNGCLIYPGKYSPYRIIYELKFGELEPKIVLRHSCDNKQCCNLDHLKPGTQAQNNEDMVLRGRSNRGEKHWNWKDGSSKNYRKGNNLNYMPRGQAH